MKLNRVEKALMNNPVRSAHHEGAVNMTEDALRRAGDPCLRTFAYSVRHAESGQIR